MMLGFTVKDIESLKPIFFVIVKKCRWTKDIIKYTRQKMEMIQSTEHEIKLSPALLRLSNLLIILISPNNPLIKTRFDMKGLGVPDL